MPLMKDQVVARQRHLQHRRPSTRRPGAYRHRKPDKIRLRLPRRWSVLPLRLFFDGWPPLLIPVSDRFFIPLGRSLYWLLSTPARFTQQPSDVITMIAHPKRPVNYLSDTVGSPHISPKTVGFRSFGQQVRDLGLLLCR